jgi:hypothetical protein
LTSEDDSREIDVIIAEMIEGVNVQFIFVAAGFVLPCGVFADCESTL